MDDRNRVTIVEGKTTNYLERFDKIRGQVSRSKAILNVLQHFIDYDPNYLRGVLGLTPLTESELLELKAMITPPIVVQTEIQSPVAT